VVVYVSADSCLEGSGTSNQRYAAEPVLCQRQRMIGSTQTSRMMAASYFLPEAGNEKKTFYIIILMCLASIFLC